jgi:DnaJ-class molecular chaperone
MSDIVSEIKVALEVLNLPPLVSLNEIKTRYRILSKKHHPDINEENSKMREINEAYELLKAYANNFRFTFSEEEIQKQFPESNHARKFRF